MSELGVIRQEVSVEILTPHPINASIYGENEDVSSLAKLIEKSGWVKPLVVTKDYVIVSGHRRWKALKELGWKTITVEFTEFADDTAILEALLLENATREKTLLVRIREGMAWEKLEEERAASRQGTRTDLANMVENFPPCSPQTKFSKSRDAIGSRVGLSGRSYAKGRKVVETMDSEDSQGEVSSASALRIALNKSIDAAYKLAIRPRTTREAIGNLLKTGKAANVTAAIRLVSEQTQANESAQTPSCWNCQHRGEHIDNQNIYCYKEGILNVIQKSGEERGKDCAEWKDNSLPAEPLKKTVFVLPVVLPLEWQAQLEKTAVAVGTDASTWVKNLIGANLSLSSELAQTSGEKALLV